MYLEFDTFCRYSPKVRNHHVPALIYIVANNHMYPVLEDEPRKSIVASERMKGKESTVFTSKEKQANTFVGSAHPLLNVPYDILNQHKNCNVIYTNKSDLLDLVVYFVQKEQTVY